MWCYIWCQYSYKSGYTSGLSDDVKSGSIYIKCETGDAGHAGAKVTITSNTGVIIFTTYISADGLNTKTEKTFDLTWD